MIKINRVKLKESVPVYDLTVESTESFFANDTLVHNCAEINLPTQSFTSLDDEGEYKLALDNGEDVTLPGQHLVLLRDGSMKKVKELTEEDDIENLLI